MLLMTLSSFFLPVSCEAVSEGWDDMDHDGYGVDPDSILVAWLVVPEYWGIFWVLFNLDFCQGPNPELYSPFLLKLICKGLNPEEYPTPSCIIHSCRN